MFINRYDIFHDLLYVMLSHCSSDLATITAFIHLQKI